MPQLYPFAGSNPAMSTNCYVDSLMEKRWSPKPEDVGSNPTRRAK